MIMKIPQEPRLDPDCNQFKDFLVDHPCLNAKLKGYPRRHHDDDGGDDNDDDDGGDDFLISLPATNKALSLCVLGLGVLEGFRGSSWPTHTPSVPP